ncbi:MAG TPA: sigma-70 family RNA polymerase sigma factor [Solirubrobacterales bacterium]|nr:sigma-70 family RNA polymerase sigma factor [Solirubrobacterales bacterium]HMU25842.1 sigma-70 family RNA polymerase sigma factor [Solirubrobacterales bacterium]HMX70233.1 sigma-70 family RNA polymerase sigma factor [Solirubrobacterales bacterium]HMY24804.1 sigma-70 family RNA polymerase sigma factor [Solirubrobacterales bacterium]HNA24434.1 sigma-70 family RNA polymerase sigma factor [Solirubrobacterales bacterium]
MRGVAVQGTEEHDAGIRPDEAARKRVAVELIRNHDRPLRWTARRYSICPEDAEDAYQRGIEILLSKAPTTDTRHLLPWTRKVIKHEALAIRRTRERTLARPGQSDIDEHLEDDWVQLIPDISDGPDELTVRRERVARSREALTQLKPQELKALTQLAEGFSYDEIGSMNSWTRTKVNRCLAEGRARFRSTFRESEAGERCPEFEPMISASCDGELTSSQVAELETHLAVCGHCRSTLRAYRAAPRAAAALAPLLPAGRGLWERTQELAVDLQTRLSGVGRGSDSGVQTVLASGGTRGAGMAAIAKIAAICAGTAGTAAVCAATGVLPAANLLPHKDAKPVVERHASVARPEPERRKLDFVEPAPEPSTAPQSQAGGSPDQSATAAEPVSTTPEPVSEAPVITESAPAPTPTETEFTPEAAGTPAPAAAPPPQPASSSSSVPVGNGGGEFSP